ncbi:unnamed protein product, partial [Medioppia subpectinata]
MVYNYIEPLIQGNCLTLDLPESECECVLCGFAYKMSTQSSPQPHPPQQQSDTSLSERRLSALKVVKYLFISSLIILIIGSVVLFGLSIDSIVNISANIDTIERFGVTELAVKRTERLQQQSIYCFLFCFVELLMHILF